MKQKNVENLQKRFYVCGICNSLHVEGGLNLLHEADDNAVMWLGSTATAALAK